MAKAKMIIDGDAIPFCPSDLSVAVHKTCGQLELECLKRGLFLNGRKIKLFFSSRQRVGNSTNGRKLFVWTLQGKLTLNANILDFLLAHPKIIPNSWKKFAIVFWGTVYRDEDGQTWVRYLCWAGGKWNEWYWNRASLESDFNSCCPAAIVSLPKEKI